MKKRANYNLLETKLKKNKSFELTREQLSNTVDGYISDNPTYLKNKKAPLYRKALEFGYEIKSNL
ncbi:MAG: hypothetical protein VZS44_00750 [Bacilli bacterium]|nr:hypothetical protein [Bacilli bacterium]